MATPFITLIEAKAYLNMTSSADDAELTRFIAAACAACERHRDHRIGEETVTEEFQVDDPTFTVSLSATPIIDVIAVENDAHSWDLSTLRVRRNLGRLISRDVAFEGAVEVTYSAGFAEVPADWKQAALVLLAHLWSTQRRATAGPRPGRGEDDYNPGTAYSLPYRVQELLGHGFTGIA